MHQPQTQPQPPSLRLFTADEAADDSPGDGLSPAMTLSQFYELWVLPHCRMVEARSSKTIKQDRESLSYWARFTGDPPMAQIDRETGRLFIEGVKALPGRRKSDTIAANTVRKHCTHIQFILDRAGPGNGRDKEGAGLLEQGIYLKRPRKTYREAVDNFSLDEIWRMISACGHAGKSKHLRLVDPETFHRSLLIFEYNTGLRIETTILLTRDMLFEDARGLWVIIPPSIYKGHWHGLRMFLNRHAVGAIDAVKTSLATIFPWENWPQSESALHTHRRKIMKAADVIRPGVGFHGFRKTLLTWVAARNPMLAKIIAGHRGGDVTRDHYVDPRIMADILDKVPQPGPPVQKYLF